MPKFNLVLVGCGKMGESMLHGWLESGMIETCHVVDPGMDNTAFDNTAAVKIHHRADSLPETCDIVVFAVKPQIMADVLSDYKSLIQNGASGLTIAAGIPLSLLENVYGEQAKLIRAMPNTPASIAQGMTGLFANTNVTDNEREKAEKLMRALGEVIWCENEDRLNDVTALSGSGPAYVFYMIEAMAAAGEALGFAPETAMKLARQTVIGAAALVAKETDTEIATLRKNVTSPGGTTEAGLKTLMDTESGLSPLMRETIQVAADRSRALAKG